MFREDPFFQEGFKDLDDEFIRRFQSQTSRHNSLSHNSDYIAKNKATTIGYDRKMREALNTNPEVRSKEGWIPWLLRQCGIEFQVTSYTSNGHGGYARTKYCSVGRSGYSQKQSKSYLDWQGRHVSIQSMEQNGNQIEDIRVDHRLVQRKVNGVIEPLERIGKW